MSNPGKDPLVGGLAAGHEPAFAQLCDRYAGRLYRAAWAILGRREDAEDAVQEVFMALVRSRTRLGEVRDLTAYLFTSLRRAAARAAERRAREPRLGDVTGHALARENSPGGNDPRSERLTRALAALPSDQREVIALKIDGELTFAEIGQVMGVSINTAASRYRYALERLRAALGAGPPQPMPKE